jgi:hypothetical protein
MKAKGARKVRHSETHTKRRARSRRSIHKVPVKHQQRNVPFAKVQGGVTAPSPTNSEMATSKAETRRENEVTVIEVVEFGVMEGPEETLIGINSETEPESEEDIEVWTLT